MITAFEIEGFKCFTRQRVELGAMTVLCGVNGAGKSSFVQALLLAHLAAGGSRQIALNGPYDLRLGRALDIFRSASIRLTAEGSTGNATWAFSAKADDALSIEVDEAALGTTVPSELASVLYLQAERLGPRDLQEIDSTPTGTVNIGARGEYVAQVLDLDTGRRPVRPELCHPGHVGSPPPPGTLPKQAEAWLQELVPGIELRVEPFPTLSAAAVRLRRPGQTAEWLRPQNIGFGVSYVLPVIVAALVAQPGSMIVVENPEAHLHPQGQSLLAQFLARVAASGVQIVIETHSDHFLNGLRLSSVSNGSFQPDHLAIQFFSCDDSVVNVTRIHVSSRGSFSAAPPTFFDQSEKDLAAILKARRRD